MLVPTFLPLPPAWAASVPGIHSHGIFKVYGEDEPVNYDETATLDSKDDEDDYMAEQYINSPDW